MENGCTSVELVVFTCLCWLDLFLIWLLLVNLSAGGLVVVGVWLDCRHLDCRLGGVCDRVINAATTGC